MNYKRKDVSVNVNLNVNLKYFLRLLLRTDIHTYRRNSKAKHYMPPASRHKMYICPNHFRGRGLDTFGRFFCHFYMDNFCDFLFAFLYI